MKTVRMYIFIWILAAIFLFELTSCNSRTNSDTCNFYEEVDSIAMSPFPETKTINAPQDSIINNIEDILEEEPEYRDVELSMDLVIINYDQLNSFLKKYVVPSVKKHGYNKRNTFVTVRVNSPEEVMYYYVTEEQKIVADAIYSFDNPVKILSISVSDCGVYAYADKINQGKVKVAIVDDIPIMFLECAKLFTSPTIEGGKYIWGKYRFYRDPFRTLSTCDDDCRWQFVLDKNNMYFFEFIDLGFNIPLSREKYIPQVSEVIQKKINMIKNHHLNCELSEQIDSTSVMIDTIP